MRNLLLISTFTLCSITVYCQEIFTHDAIAIRGYDAVAYFTEQKPVEGKSEFTHQWNNATWRFASQKNLDDFKNSPEKYAPQFGGYCAYGVSEDHKSPTHPEAFTIVDGKLYLNYNLKVKELWSKDREGRIKAAETNWVKLRKVPAN